VAGAEAALAAPAGRVSGPFWPQPAARPSNRHKVVFVRQVAARGRTATLIDDCSTMPRILSTMSSCPDATPLSDAEYGRITAAVLSAIEATADCWLQDDVIDIDTQRTGGLLELVFPNDSRIIVNTQPPLQEIWLAARGGGFHYRHVGGQWLDTRDGSEFFEALSRHASAQSGIELRFAAPG
jgi:CyaY protein